MLSIIFKSEQTNTINIEYKYKQIEDIFKCHHTFKDNNLDIEIYINNNLVWDENYWPDNYLYNDNDIIQSSRYLLTELVVNRCLVKLYLSIKTIDNICYITDIIIKFIDYTRLPNREIINFFDNNKLKYIFFEEDVYPETYLLYTVYMQNNMYIKQYIGQRLKIFNKDYLSRLFSILKYDDFEPELYPDRITFSYNNIIYWSIVYSIGPYNEIVVSNYNL